MKDSYGRGRVGIDHEAHNHPLPSLYSPLVVGRIQDHTAARHHLSCAFYLFELPLVGRVSVFYCFCVPQFGRTFTFHAHT